jgi:hypothetical protein
MSANSIVTIDAIADRTLAVMHEKIQFIGSVNRDYDEEFSKKHNGFKQGDAIRIKNPNQYTRRQNSRVAAVQATSETTQSLVVATQDGVDLEWNSAEMSLGLDNYTKRCIEPAVDTLISGIEADFIAAMTKATYNTVGTAGVVPGASADTTVIGLARAKLNQYLAPKSKRSFMIDSATMASLVNANKALFQPTGAVGEQFKEGLISRNATADFYENERIWTLANPADVAGEIDESAETNFTEGTTVVHMDGLGTASDIVAGMVFTWEGLYAVHPETKQVYSHLQDFTVVSVANPSTGDADITFSPAIYTTGAKQNVKTQTGGAVTWTAAGQDGKDITFRGSASVSYKYGLMYHQDAFTFATAALPIMNTGECSVRNYEGLGIRMWRAGDIVNDREILRLDILYGWLAQRPQHAVRVILN